MPKSGLNVVLSPGFSLVGFKDGISVVRYNDGDNDGWPAGSIVSMDGAIVRNMEGLE